MIVWVRELKRRRLAKIDLEPELETGKMVEQDRNKKALNEIFYPPQSSLPSCLIYLP